MKNVNYNLIKLLHLELDNSWRVEKHYLKDAQAAKCGCAKMLKRIDADYKRHIAALKAELIKHHKKDKLA